MSGLVLERGTTVSLGRRVSTTQVGGVVQCASMWSQGLSAYRPQFRFASRRLVIRKRYYFCGIEMVDLYASKRRGVPAGSAPDPSRRCLICV